MADDSQTGGPYADDKTKITRDKQQVPCAALPPGIRGRLEFIGGPEKGRVVLLEKPVNTLGRHHDNTVVLTDPGASAHHAAVYFVQSLEWRIADDRSTNGTLLNGAQVKEYALRNGDKILIGDTLLVFKNE